jgi:hypothetical protein
MMTNRALTPKEQKVVQAFDRAHPELGKAAEANIRNKASGWAAQIEATPAEEIPDRATSGQASNSHIYRHIGH